MLICSNLELKSIALCVHFLRGREGRVAVDSSQFLAETITFVAGLDGTELHAAGRCRGRAQEALEWPDQGMWCFCHCRPTSTSVESCRLACSASPATQPESSSRLESSARHRQYWRSSAVPRHPGSRQTRAALGRREQGHIHAFSFTTRGAAPSCL
jgi:hypothetical protein